MIRIPKLIQNIAKFVNYMLVELAKMDTNSQITVVLNVDNIMTIADILQEAVKDIGKINKDEIIAESARIPEIFNKYHQFYEAVRLVKFQTKKKLSLMEREKFEYYKGIADPEVYKKKPLGIKLKTDAGVQRYVDADEELGRLRDEFELLQEKEAVIKRILDQINNRSFHINNMNKSMEFFHGNRN